MIAQYKSGKTMQQIGNRYRITRQRVQQVFFEHDVKWTDGGFHVKCHNRKLAKIEAYKNQWMKHYGCKRFEYTAIMPGKFAVNRNNLAYSYTALRRNNIGRFNLSFPAWHKLWQDSGLWDKRGLHKGQYVMSRIDKSKPYELGNVRVVLSENKYKGKKGRL